MSSTNGNARQLPDHVKVAIIGSGFSGLGMAVRLKKAFIDDYVVLERAGDVGGTWHVNTYPGCQCDVPSHVYSFSFAPNPDWSRTFSRQPEIWEYLRRVADEKGVMPKVHLNTNVDEAAWDDEHRVWSLQTSKGSMTADVLISGVGGLAEPSLPDIPGIKDFKGKIFHSAEWDHDHDLKGRRVAVIGTGSSAIQFVPEIRKIAGHVEVFQRTAPWIMPHADRPVSSLEHGVYGLVPRAQKAMRSAIYWARETWVLGFTRPNPFMRIGEAIANRHRTKQVKDPELLAKVTPDYRMGCKRVILSNKWYPALASDNVDLVTSAIKEVHEDAIVTEDGERHEVDTIILGTGFHVTDSPALNGIRGKDGRTLAEVWQGSPRVYLGTTIVGFPNLFVLLGPGTGLGHNSVVFMIESQIRYVIDCLRKMQDRDLQTVEVKPDTEEAYAAEMDRKLKGSVWITGGCDSFYLDSSGRSVNWPGTSWSFRQRTRTFDLDNYELGRREERRVVPAEPATATVT